MNDLTRASLRTGWFAGILALVLGAVNRYTGLNLKVDDLLPLAPLAAVIAGVAYRASRVVADKWPTIGFILFGSTQTPTYTPPKEG